MKKFCYFGLNLQLLDLKIGLSTFWFFFSLSAKSIGPEKGDFTMLFKWIFWPFYTNFVNLRVSAVALFLQVVGVSADAGVSAVAGVWRLFRRCFHDDPIVSLLLQILLLPLPSLESHFLHASLLLLATLQLLATQRLLAT
jgi:hypothetical protein